MPGGTCWGWYVFIPWAPSACQAVLIDVCAACTALQVPSSPQHSAGHC
jgi:hypothetical protein